MAEFFILPHMSYNARKTITDADFSPTRQGYPISVKVSHIHPAQGTPTMDGAASPDAFVHSPGAG
ncbi:MAG: hypothetical protein ABI465_01200 [Ktedonobacteraceae bacterium]